MQTVNEITADSLTRREIDLDTQRANVAYCEYSYRIATLANRTDAMDLMHKWLNADRDYFEASLALRQDRTRLMFALEDEIAKLRGAR